MKKIKAGDEVEKLRIEWETLVEDTEQDLVSMASTRTTFCRANKNNVINMKKSLQDYEV